MKAFKPTLLVPLHHLQIKLHKQISTWIHKCYVSYWPTSFLCGQKHDIDPKATHTLIVHCTMLKANVGYFCLINSPSLEYAYYADMPDMLGIKKVWAHNTLLNWPFLSSRWKISDLECLIMPFIRFWPTFPRTWSQYWVRAESDVSSLAYILHVMQYSARDARREDIWKRALRQSLAFYQGLLSIVKRDSTCDVRKTRADMK